MCTHYSLHDIVKFTSHLLFIMLNENKIKLKHFIFNLFLTLFFITQIYYELNMSQHKNFLHSTQQQPTNHFFYTKLHMHEIQLHAPIPSLFPTLNQLATTRETQLCTTPNLVTPVELTSTTILNKIHYHRFGNRLSASIRNRSQLFAFTILETADLTTSDSTLTPSSQPEPMMLDVPARQSPTLNTPATLAYNTWSNSPPLRTLGCTYGPSNSCDPGSVTAGSGSPPPLWTPDFIAPGPTNPHDPGPKVGGPRASRTSLWSVNSLLPLQYPSIIIVACLITSSITFSTISQFATNDHLCIPPRSPQFLYVMCFM